MCAYPSGWALPAGSCSWYVPGQETYMLTIDDDGSNAVAYDYTISAVLASGEQVTISGQVQRSNGGTYVAPLLFGGIAQTANVVITDLYETASLARKGRK